VLHTSLTRKYKISLETIAKGKHSSLFFCGESDEERKFINVKPDDRQDDDSLAGSDFCPLWPMA